MGKINVLSFAVANLIAAGEVVDRPSSVIKELLENAIDSGASRITVEIQNGGVTYMRVADNGCGISRDDLPLSIKRHATSKIKDASDLDGIITLGFRGEALAAISSVTDMRIISKTADADVGTMLVAHGGNIESITDRASSVGTTVIVENLFANVPARRKFLKKDATESMAVSAVVEKIALSKPHIAFKLIIDGQPKLETIGDGNLKNTIYSIFGKEFTSKLIPTSIEADGIKISGYIGRSDNVRANRNYQNFFINGRFVKSKTVCAALEQAYTSYIPSDKFPCCVLNLTLSPVAVDVNVHPAKLEVKFSNEKLVFEAVYYSVKNAIEENTARPSISFGKVSAANRPISDSQIPISDGKKESLKQRQIESEIYVKKSFDQTPKATTDNKSNEAFAHITAKEYSEMFAAKKSAHKEEIKINIPENEPKKVIAPVEAPRSVPKPEAKAEVKPEAKQNSYSAGEIGHVAPIVESKDISKPLKHRIVGEVFNSYVIVEVGDKMLLIDKHAAHERIIFETLKAGMNSDNVGTQMLMFPIEIMMTSEEIQTIIQYRAEVEAVGFEFTSGKYTLNVTAIPEGIKTEAVSDMLAVMAERIKSNTGSAKLTRDIIFEKALYQASCKAAIKAGREYSDEHIKWIVDKLMEFPDITVCPHGRPVAMELTKKELDNQFERT